MKALILALLLLSPFPAFANDCETAKASVRDGDLIFLEIDKFLFREVAEASLSWTSHVGVVFQEKNKWVVYESKIPVSTVTPLCDYIKRSKNGRFALTRKKGGLSADQSEAMLAKAKKLLGYFYHQGFDFDGNRMFCSKFSYLVYQAAGLGAGRLETFQELFDAFPEGPAKIALIGFWNRWFRAGFHSGVPFQRRTVTPASQLNDESFDVILGNREI